MGLMRDLFGPSQKEIWGLLADQVGGSFAEGGFWQPGNVQARSGDWIVTLDTYTVSTGKSSVTYTRLRAPFVNRDGFRFQLTRRNLFTDIGVALFGMQDLVVGSPILDQAFVIQANNEPKIRELLSDQRIADLVLTAAFSGVRIQQGPSGFFGTTYPAGVDELYFVAGGVIRDLNQLRGLFELFSLILHRLAHMDSAYADDEQIFIRTVRGPGGKVQSSGVTLWDGDMVRISAVERLGAARSQAAVPVLHATLLDPNPFMRAASAEALGKIGDGTATPVLTQLLGDEEAAGSEVVGTAAARALGMLGRADVVNKFEGSLRGDPAALAQVRADGITPYLLGFSRAVEKAGLERAIQAAVALGELGAVQHVKQIRDLRRKLGREMPGARERVDHALDLLERTQELPRAAAAPAADPTQLPLPASSPGPEPHNLPRPTGASGRD